MEKRKKAVEKQLTSERGKRQGYAYVWHGEKKGKDHKKPPPEISGQGVTFPTEDADRD